MLNYNKELNFFSRALEFNGPLLFPRVKGSKNFSHNMGYNIRLSGEHISDMLVFCILSMCTLSSNSRVTTVLQAMLAE